MKIYSVYDPEFKPYGQIVTGMDETVQELLGALATTPLPDGTGYVPEEPALQGLPAAKVVSEHLYGGMPVQLGWCNGHNTKLNCLEYHRDSEFNLGTEDFISRRPSGLRKTRVKGNSLAHRTTWLRSDLRYARSAGLVQWP